MTTSKRLVWVFLLSGWWIMYEYYRERYHVNHFWELQRLAHPFEIFTHLFEWLSKLFEWLIKLFKLFIHLFKTVCAFVWNFYPSIRTADQTFQIIYSFIQKIRQTVWMLQGQFVNRSLLLANESIKAQFRRYASLTPNLIQPYLWQKHGRNKASESKVFNQVQQSN